MIDSDCVFEFWYDTVTDSSRPRPITFERAKLPEIFVVDDTPVVTVVDTVFV